MFPTEDIILIPNHALQLAFHFLVFLMIIYLTGPSFLVFLFTQALHAAAYISAQSSIPLLVSLSFTIPLL